MNLLVGDCRAQLRTLDAGSVRTCVTSPPYWGLRDYGITGQLGNESTPDAYVVALVGVFREVRRVLADDGTLWLNLGDSHVDRELVGIPWLVAFALRADGWHLRSDVIWHKPNPKPESVKDRPTKSHEHLFLCSKSRRYYYDADAIREVAVSRGVGGRVKPGVKSHANQQGGKASSGLGKLSAYRNKRDVWSIAPSAYKGAHFAVMPTGLVEPCVLAGSTPGDTVLDPFCGAGTVGVVARQHGRKFIGVELNPEYAALTRARWSA